MLRTLLFATLIAVPVHAASRPRQMRVSGKLSMLDDISFLEHSATLTAEARRELDEVARTLADNPDMRIEVQSTLEPGLTRTIAQRRAAAVRAYLDTRGVDDHRLATRVVRKGAGIQLVLQ